MKHFIVSDRNEDYDFRTVGIYSTRELAEEAHRRIGSDLAIDEVEVDAMPPLPSGLYVWNVSFERDAIARVDRGDTRIWEGEKAWICPGSADGAGTLYGHPVAPRSIIHCLARDEDHAKTVAAELRPRALAEYERLGPGTFQFPIPQP